MSKKWVGGVLRWPLEFATELLGDSFCVALICFIAGIALAGYLSFLIYG